jgi:hypothetical protein
VIKQVYLLGLVTAFLTYLSLTAVRLRDERDEWRRVNSENVEYYKIKLKECGHDER